MPRQTSSRGPVERLRRLTIDEPAIGSETSAEHQGRSMVRTRSGAGQSESGAEPPQQGPGSPDSDSSTTGDESEEEMFGGETDPGNLTIFPGSGYDYNQMTPQTEGRARRAFDADELSISHCRAWELDGVTYFNFSLREQIGIHIEPSEDVSGHAVCTCGQSSPCKHIWWLEHQLVQARNPHQNWSFVNDGSTISGVPLHLWILENGIDRLSASGDWPLVPEAAEPGEDFSQRRDAELSDMLAPFAPLSQDETAYSTAYDALDDAVREIVEFDRGIFERFRKALDSDLCAQARFEKNNRIRIEGAFATLDLYSRIGPPSDGPPGTPVSGCANALEQTVEAIRADLRSHPGTPFIRIALSLLLQIIQGIVTRNTDIYVSKPWASQVQAPTDQRERNLYLHLVRTPPPSSQLFMIDLLREFPGEALQNHRDTVFQIMDQIKRNGGPDRYYAALRDLVAPRATSSGKGTATSKKRGGDSGEGSSQPKRGR